MNSEYGFYLTDAQQNAIRDVSVDKSELHFSATGSVVGIVFDEYDVTTYTFRKDGGIVKETRDFTGNDGWTTWCRDHNGKWVDDEGVEVVDG